MKIVALVPLRGGSKSILNKNIKKLNGKPLCFWILNSLLMCRSVNEIYVSTDSNEIIKTVKKIDKKINIIKRPKYLAKDDTSTEDVMLHFAKMVEFDALVTAQATSPLTKSTDLSKAIKQFEKEKLDSLLTAVRYKRFFWDENNRPINYNPFKRPMRQKFNGTLTETGSFYITSYNYLIKKKCRIGGKIGIYEMDIQNFIELDEPADWIKIAELFKNKNT